MAALLLDTLEHWHTNARLLQTMISWWLDAPPASQPVALPTTFSSELNDTLMRNRNQHWRELLLALPRGRMWWRSVHCICTAKTICRSC